MGSKKNTPKATTSQPALRIGSTVRCTDDGVTGRITWANAVSVKIKWDDGEQVTWKRDSLATRPIEILDAEDAGMAEAPVAEAEATVEAGVEQVAPPAAAEEPQVEQPAAETTPEAPVAEQADLGVATPSAVVPPEATVPVQAPAPAKAKRQRKPKAKAEAAPIEKKLSALDAAAKV